MRFFRTAVVLTSLFSCYAVQPAWADEAASAAEEASRQQASEAESFRRETAAAPALEPDTNIVVVPSKEDEAVPADENGPRFVLKSVRFDGNTFFSSKDLAPYADAYLGQSAGFKELDAIARSVTEHYRSRGYLTSRAYMGPQRIENGAVTIQVIEGRLGRTLVEGNRYFSTEKIQEALTLPASDGPFEFGALEKRIRFLNRNPDFRSSAYLTPGETPLTSDLHVKVEDKLPLHTAYEFNNRGTKLTHRSRHLVSGTHNNFTGNLDTLSLTAGLAEEGAFQALSGAWSVPFWNTGTLFLLSGSYVDSALKKHLAPSDITGTSWSVVPAVFQELIATPRQQLVLYTGFEIKDSKTSTVGEKTSLDRLRVLVAGPRWSRLDASGRTSLSADIHWGIPRFLGGSEAEDLDASRVRAGGDFVYYSGSVSRAQRLPFGLTGVLKGSGQWSDTALTSPEQFSIGGSSTVRGYPEADSAGDYGYVGTAEISAPLPAPDGWLVPFTDSRVNQSVRWLGFFDAGKAFDHDRAARTDVKDRMLMGVGFGFRLYLKNSVTAQFDYGWPVGDDSTDQGDQPQAHFSVRAGF